MTLLTALAHTAAIAGCLLSAWFGLAVSGLGSPNTGLAVVAIASVSLLLMVAGPVAAWGLGGGRNAATVYVGTGALLLVAAAVLLVTAPTPAGTVGTTSASDEVPPLAMALFAITLPTSWPMLLLVLVAVGRGVHRASLGADPGAGAERLPQ